MDVILNSKHNYFKEYIKNLQLSDSNGNINIIIPKKNDWIEIVSRNKDVVIILDAHSDEPYSACSSITCLDKLWQQGLNNPVIILGWLTLDYLNKSLSADISCYLSASFYKDSYKYLRLPITTESFLAHIHDVKPLNPKYHE